MNGTFLSSSTLLLTNLNYQAEDYAEALRLRRDGEQGYEMEYNDLLDALEDIVGEHQLRELTTSLSAVIDEDESGRAWTGKAGRLADQVRDIIEQGT